MKCLGSPRRPRGLCTLTVSSNGSSVTFVLKVTNIRNLTVARLHQGAQGKNGSTIVTLYAGPTKSGTFTGTVAQGSFTKANLVGPLKGKTITDLVALLKAGTVYLNVGTTSHASGEHPGAAPVAAAKASGVPGDAVTLTGAVRRRRRRRLKVRMAI